MSDRVHSITVVLDQNLREDDVLPILNAIQQLRGVMSVGTNIASVTDYVAEQRARRELGDKIMKIIYPEA